MTRKHETHSSKVEMIPINELVEYEKNPKKHTGEAIDELCKSIEKFGFTQPILIDQKKRIIAGHKRKKAALKLNRSKVPCVIIELTDKEYYELMLVDNKMSEISKIDKKLHKEVMEILQGLDSALSDIPGYNDEEIDKIFGIATKETIDGTGDFGDGKEIDGTIDEDARVVSMTFKIPKKNHTKIKDVLEAVKRENELETLSESLIFCMSHFKGSTKTIRRGQ